MRLSFWPKFRQVTAGRVAQGLLQPDCGVVRGVANRAYCPDYGCGKPEGFVVNVPMARATLEEIRRVMQ